MNRIQFPYMTRADVLSVMRGECVRRGDFVLASGEFSTVYVDAKQVTLHPWGAWAIGQLVGEMIQQHAPDATAVAGPALGAVPIVAAAVTVSMQGPVPLRGLVVRMAPKAHGLTTDLEGPVAGCGPCVVVDDVVTSGTALALAIDRLRAAGVHVALALALVDREAGFAERMAQLDVPAVSVFTLTELLAD